MPLKAVGRVTKNFFKRMYEGATLKSLIKDNIKFNLILDSAIEGYDYFTGNKKPLKQVAKNLAISAASGVPQGIAEYVIAKKIFKL